MVFHHMNRNGTSKKILNLSNNSKIRNINKKSMTIIISIPLQMETKSKFQQIILDSWVLKANTKHSKISKDLYKLEKALLSIIIVGHHLDGMFTILKYNCVNVNQVMVKNVNKSGLDVIMQVTPNMDYLVTQKLLRLLNIHGGYQQNYMVQDMMKKFNL